MSITRKFRLLGILSVVRGRVNRKADQPNGGGNVTSPLCRKCGVLLSPWHRDQGKEWHTVCEPESSFSDPEVLPSRFTNGDSYATQLREDIIDIVLWANGRSERSQQVELGASEVGTPCLRRLGYRMANVREVNVDNDPWPAIVGTAVHSWLETAVNRYEQVHRVGRWETEMKVMAGPIPGHTDAYDKEFFAVIDYKNPGTTAMTEIRKGHIDPQYIEQIQMYGYGHRQAGRRVDKVALVFFPRAGYLQGTYVWSAPYDETVALAALDRVKRVAAGHHYYKVAENPANWEKIPAAPSKSCTWCPWYKPDALSASDAGCPSK
jgi:hypothetical protein